MNPLFWWEPATGTKPAPTLSAVDIQRAFGATEASFLGSGAFGETWRFKDQSGGAHAAKVILDESYPQSLLEREVGGLRRVSDARVVALEDVLTVPLSIGPRPALIFEFIDGGDVAGRVQSAAWPSFEETHGFVRGLLGAVVELHANETVHRDIKPENVALRGSWAAPVLLDLGLAKLLDAETLTQYPALRGTCPFMAPEQIQQQEGRKQADVWAVGVVAHILLAHDHPFLDGRANPVLADEALRRMRTGPRHLPTGVPDPLATVVQRLLSYEEHERGSASRAYREMGGTTNNG